MSSRIQRYLNLFGAGGENAIAQGGVAREASIIKTIWQDAYQVAQTKAGILIILNAFSFLIFFTHMGTNSPYTYVIPIVKGHSTPNIDGHFVNGDVKAVTPVTKYFYFPRIRKMPDRAINFFTPPHSYLVAIVTSFTRSNLISNYIANLLFVFLIIVVAVNYAWRSFVSPINILLTGMIVLSLPYFSHYIGQPIQYIVDPTLSFMIILCVLALARMGVKNPYLFGLLTGFLGLNYDPYIYVFALFVFFILFYRFPKLWHYGVYFVLTFAPVYLWVRFLKWASHGHIPQEQKAFFDAVIDGWYSVYLRPAKNLFLPYLASHIGIVTGIKHILANFYWPTLLIITAFIFVYSPRFIKLVKRKNYQATVMIAIVIGFIGHQMATAAFDWENSPRRAIPLVLVFGFATSWILKQTSVTRWRHLFGGILGLNILLSFADTIFKYVAIGLLPIGEFARGSVKQALDFNKIRLDSSTIANLGIDGTIRLGNIEKAIFHKKFLLEFMVCQLVFTFFIFVVFYALGRARLLPDVSKYIFLGITLLSLVVRFI